MEIKCICFDIVMIFDLNSVAVKRNKMIVVSQKQKKKLDVFMSNPFSRYVSFIVLYNLIELNSKHELVQ